MILDIENHLEKFPHVAITAQEGRIYGQWIIGNTYRSTTSYYGSYPHSFMERVLSLIPNVNPQSILHLFSGSVDQGITFDVNPFLKPQICGDAERLSQYFEKDSIPVCIADPPYSSEEAQKYGTGMPATHKVFRELYHIIEPDGLVFWLCTRIPMWRKEQWYMKGLIGVFVGTNKVYRALLIMEKRRR